MPADTSWRKIFEDYKILDHDFRKSPYLLTNEKIKVACQDFKKTGEKEVRILCKQDTREDRPQVFRDNRLFLLPVKNGEYAIIQGEGYVDIPAIKSAAAPYESQLSFVPDTSSVGNSEMQHLDLAYAASLIRSFVGDDTLVLTIRGRKYTPPFSFVAGDHRNRIEQKSVQTEVDGGYEGESMVALIEAKNSAASNVIIRQLYYPYRQWQAHTRKPVHLLFFEKRADEYCIWEFAFEDPQNYNSIICRNSARFSLGR